MIFSIFGKKKAQTDASTIDTKTVKDGNALSGLKANTNPGFTNSIVDLRHKAKATQLKIDEIESEMARDIFTKNNAPSEGTKVAQPINTNADLLEELKSREVAQRAYKTTHFATTMPLMGETTQLLLNSTAGRISETAAIESIPAIDEAAILFASGQTAAAELILHNLTRQETRHGLHSIPWLMLFDLYQITNEKSKFDKLSLDYVRKLEISAPLWQVGQTADPKSKQSYVPGITFSGKLDSSIISQTDKLISAVEKNKQVRVEFVRTTDINMDGCRYLLAALLAAKKAQCELTVVGAQDLIKIVRPLLQPGRRDPEAYAWLLLLELLQILNDEISFERLSMDYCVTYEISPPAYEKPQNIVTAESAGISVEFAEVERFLMPKVIENNIDALIEKITIFAEKHHSLQLDCKELDRVDFSVCGQLLSGLIPLSTKLNVPIEFQDVNHLVIALLTALGFKNVASIIPRKR